MNRSIKWKISHHPFDVYVVDTSALVPSVGGT